MSTARRLVAIVCLLGTLGGSPLLGCPLEVSADGRSIIDCTGEPVALNADASWHLFARLTRDEATDYLDAVRAKGINALLVSLIVADGYSGSTRNAYGEEPFNRPGDFATPNEAYFAHIDWVITQALSRGFTLLIAPAYLGFGCGHEGWCRQMKAAGPAKMRKWGQWVGKRYQGFDPIIWVNGGDADAEAHDALAEVDAVANGILSADARHLHAAHCRRNQAAADCYDQPWLDLNTTYGECLSTPRRLHDAYFSQPVRPNIYIEGQYEYHEKSSAQCVRAQAYAAGLGGAVGHVFGSERIWDFPPDWRDWLDTPGYRAVAVCGNLLTARGWPALVPDYDHEGLTDGHGSLDSNEYVSAARGVNRKTFLAYLPTSRAVTVSLAAIAGDSIEVTWFDPASGDGVPVGVIPAQGSRVFTPPSGDDWVLILDDLATAWTDIWLDGNPATPPVDRQLRLFVADSQPDSHGTRVAFTGPAGTGIHLRLYDALGRRVTTLFEGAATGVLQARDWQFGTGLSGDYFLRLETARDFITRRVVLPK